jgi:hypothetical protein
MSNTISRRGALGLGGIGAAGLVAGTAGKAHAGLQEGAELGPVGAVGLAAGQVARLSAINLPERVTRDPLVDVRLDLFDDTGRLLARRVVHDLGPKVGTFLDFKFPATARAVQRIQIYAMVSFTPGGRVGATLEVYDRATGKTGFLVNPCNMPDPTLTR